MRRRPFDSTLLWLSVVWLAATPGCGRNSHWEPLPPAVPAELLRTTDILPHTGGEIVSGRNYVYCATFQLAWNELETKVFGRPIRPNGPPQMAADLHAGPKLGEQDFPPGAYLVKAGWVKDGIADQIRSEMKQRFPKATLGLSEGAEAPPALAVAYAYLQRSLPFREAFNRLPEPLTFKSKAGKARVAAFGFDHLTNSARDSVLRSQVTVFHYVDNDNFILRLNTTVPDDELVLAKVAPESTLQATLNGVLRRARNDTGNDHGKRVENLEPVVIPLLTVDVSRHYTELESLELDARQRIIFRLDETGARLESDAEIIVAEGGPSGSRRFIFDKPFLVYLKRKSSQVPYFAMWVETREVLEKSAK